MATISVSLPSDGTTADVADVNTPINTIVNEINGNLDNANIKSNAAIDGSKLANASITNSKLSTTTGEVGGAWTSWTPSWTNLTAGNGTLNYAKYTQVGKTVKLRLKFTLGSTSSVAGNPSFTLPVTPHADYTAFTAEGVMSYGLARDVSAPASYPLWAGITGSSAVLYTSGASGTYVGQFLTASSTIPFTFATSDIISLTMEYEVA